MELPSIQKLNNSNDVEFVNVLHLLFETAPSLDRLLLKKRPFDSYQDIIAQTRLILSSGAMSEDELISVINAHPKIGAATSTLSMLSLQEQSNTGVSTWKELEMLRQELVMTNEEYEKLTGFKFIIFVNARPRTVILRIMKESIVELKAGIITREVEIKRALNDMLDIAEDRLRKLGKVESSTKL